MNILGINAYHGDASACLVVDGRLVAAAAEERFNRRKHWAGFPERAIRFCLEAGGIGPQDLDHVAVSRDPDAHLQRRVVAASLNVFPRTMTAKDRLESVGRVPEISAALARALGVDRSSLRAAFHNVEHHRAHLASAFFVSPFEDAALVSVDGFGDFVSTMRGVGQDSHIEVLDWIEYPHSLGLFYTAATQYLGFPEYGDEGKVMGLAPYGIPRYADRFREILRLLPEGRFELNLDYFTHHSHGVEMTWESGSPYLAPVWAAAFVDAFGPARRRNDPLETRHHDIAASLQAMLEEALIHVCLDLYDRTSNPRLCLAGGVALNCTFNGTIREKTPFREVFVQPAAADDGTAIGAAYTIYHQIGNAPRCFVRSFVMTAPYTGPEFSDQQIETALTERGLSYHRYDTIEAVARHAARLIARGLVVGWFQGKMEFGPRALGNRSIVVDPRRPDAREILNRRIKNRESFRPFAPSILKEHVGEYFEQDYPSPFMSMAYRVRPEKRIELAATTHVDGTGRLQTVDRETNPAFWTLIRAFQEETGTPALLNTSFNENEPIVCTPGDALDCYLKTRMDAVALGNYLVVKEG